jgi:hypothetical protein
VKTPIPARGGGNYGDSRPIRVVAPASDVRFCWERLEAPLGFEPGVEVLQSHPRFPHAPFGLAEFSLKLLTLNEIAPFG